MEKKDLICIGCPLGCLLSVTLDQGIYVSVEGNTCPKGAAYAEKECTNPTRIVTSTVRVEGGTLAMVSVKTESDIPKEKISSCMSALKTICIAAPVHINDVILENAAGTGVRIVATKNVEKK